MIPDKQALADAIHDQVRATEIKVRRVRFVPRQALKRPIRVAVAALASAGECVLSDGTMLSLPQVRDAFSNAIGYKTF